MFCEQCGAELEADAGFCAMCGRQVEKDGVADVGLPKSISHLRIGVLKKGLIPVLFLVLVLGVALLLTFRSDEVDLSDVVNGKSQLSRGTAKNLIRNSPNFQELRTIVYFHSQGLQKGIDQKMWGSGSRYGTEKSRTIVSEVTYHSVKLVTPAGVPALDITGITDATPFGTAGTGVKEVQFTWTYTDLPQLIKRFASRGGTGKGYFKLYDDGWRLEDVDLQSTKEPIVLTPDEQSAEAADLSAEAADLRAWAERIAESKTPTRDLGSFPYYVGTLKDIKKRSYPRRIKLTDVNLQYEDYSYNARRILSCTTWYGNIARTEASGIGTYTRSGYEYSVYYPGFTLKIKMVRRLESVCGLAVAFVTAADRDAFRQTLDSAINAWNGKFPDVAQAKLTQEEVIGK